MFIDKNILHISALDMGGAANATIRLHQALLTLGINSHFLTLGKCNRNIPQKHIFQKEEPPISLPKVIKKSLKIRLGLESPHDFHYQQDMLLGGESKGGGFYFPDTLDDLTQSPIYQIADLIHLHWVAGWLDYPSFFRLNQSHWGDKPIVWTLHDLNPFSGGLHYAMGTPIDESSMGHFIQNPQTNLQKVHNRNLKIKEQSLQSIKKISIVSPSLWLQKQSQKSLLFAKYGNYCIHNGLNTNIFKPYPKELIRNILGLENKKTLLFIADDIDNIYKGFGLLVKALALIGNTIDYQYVVLGRDSKNVLKSFPNIKHFGFVQDEQFIALIYSVADAFVLPSLMDNFPNTMIESICCGTPVITFSTGGIPEAIIHTQNGLICDKPDADLLAQMLIDFYNDKYQFDREMIAIESAKKYSSIEQAKQYISIYDSLL